MMIILIIVIILYSKEKVKRFEIMVAVKVIKKCLGGLPFTLATFC